MTEEMFALSFKDFDNKAIKFKRKLINDTNFTDVTLACDDNGKLEAHKVILGSSSPILKQILVGNHHQHPLIYLRKVKFSCLQSLIQFMYLGKTEVAQTELQDFLNLGKELEIQGLNENTPGISTDENNSFVVPEGAREIDFKGTCESPSEVIEIEMGDKESKEISVKDEYENSTEIVQIEPTLLPETVDLNGFTYSECNSTLENDGNGFICNECGKSFTQSANLWQHKMSAHMGVRHPCDYCEYKSTTKSNLKRHVNKHHTLQ